MPALITHHLFGEESIDRLPAGIVTTPEERTAFLLANQGPDPFFFRVRTPNLSSCMQLAHRMHSAYVTRQFDALREGVTHLREHDASLGRAFVLGLLSHYTLDRNVHPFVYAQQWGIQAEDPSLADAGNEVHAVIESDLDVLMLQLKRNGATVEDYPPVSELVTTDRIDKVAGALMSYIAKTVYGLEVGANEYGGAVADMQLLYRVIEPAGSLSTCAIARIEELLKPYSLLQSLAHRVTTEQPSAAGNMGHGPWINPFDGATSHTSFPDLFDHALNDYQQTAVHFIETRNMEEVTGRMDYSGCVLEPGEEAADRK